jgi:GABA permease
VQNSSYWLPDTPQWIVSLVLLALLTATTYSQSNPLVNSSFGSHLLKLLRLVFSFSFVLYMFGLWPNHQAAGFGELLNHGGFMPNGWGPVLSGAVAATGFYFGAEIVTIAAETKDPENLLPKQLNL